MSLALAVANQLLRFLPVTTRAPESVLATARTRVPAEPNAAIAEVAHIRPDGRLVHLEPKQGATGAHLVYLHGGCYTYPILDRHWTMLATLVRDAGVTVTVPLYGLAPEHDMHEAYALLDATIAEIRTDRLYLGGDSAGGDLALGQAMRMRDAGSVQPDGVVLVAPWLDVTLGNQDIAAVLPRERMLALPGLRAAGEWWSRGDVRSPLASPAFGAAAGLPPLHVVQGGRDILAPDAIALADRVRMAGGTVEVDLVPDGFHVFPAVPALPEAKRSLERIARFLR